MLFLVNKTRYTINQGFSKSAFKGPILNFQQCQRSGPEQLVITKLVFNYLIMKLRIEFPPGPDADRRQDFEKHCCKRSIRIIIWDISP